MMPGSIANLSMFVGADYQFKDTIYQADGVTPQNIAGWTPVFTLSAYADPGTVFLSLTLANGGISIINASNGTLSIIFANANTANFRSGQYSYSVTRTDSGANTPFLSSGLFTLLSDPNNPN